MSSRRATKIIRDTRTWAQIIAAKDAEIERLWGALREIDAMPAEYPQGSRFGYQAAKATARAALANEDT